MGYVSLPEGIPRWQHACHLIQGIICVQSINHLDHFSNIVSRSLHLLHLFCIPSPARLTAKIHQPWHLKAMLIHALECQFEATSGLTVKVEWNNPCKWPKIKLIIGYAWGETKTLLVGLWLHPINMVFGPTLQYPVAPVHAKSLADSAGAKLILPVEETRLATLDVPNP